MFSDWLRILPSSVECVSLLMKCVFSLNSPAYKYLPTLRKWSVINPYHYVDAHILCIYAGVDGLNSILKSRQQECKSVIAMHELHIPAKFIARRDCNA